MLSSNGIALNDSGEEVANKIAFVSMIGPVMKYGDYCTYGADEIVRMLDRANNDETVKGILFLYRWPRRCGFSNQSLYRFCIQKTKAGCCAK